MAVGERLRLWTARRPGHSALPGTAMIWIAGLLIRLVVLPFTMHVDVYQVYSRAADAAYHGEWTSWGSQIVIQMIHDVWLLAIRPLLPESRGIWSQSASTIGLGAQAADIDRFLAYPYLARALFLMKLPYVAADVATGLALTRLVKPERRRRVLELWLLNPLTIFASAIFARHDSIAIFLVVASALAAQRGRRYLGLGLLGLGALARFFPVFLAPFFIFAYRRSRRELVVLGAGLAVVWLAVEAATWTLTGSSPTLTLLTRYPHVDFLVDLALPLGGSDWIFLFPAAYGLLVLWYMERPPYGTTDYVAAGAAMFLVMFSLTFFHPHYTVWLVPFLALSIDRHPRLIGYHVVQVALLALYGLKWGTGTTWGLLMPLGAPAVASLPDPLTIIGAAMPVDLYLGITRSLFASISLWLAYRVLRDQFVVARRERMGGPSPAEVVDAAV